MSDTFATFHKLSKIFIVQINKSMKCIMKHKQSCYFELYSFQKGYLAPQSLHNDVGSNVESLCKCYWVSD